MTQHTSPVTYEPSVVNVIERQHILKLLVFTIISWIPVLTGYNVVKVVANLFPLADSPNPYFIPAYAGLLYLLTPLVVISACLLLFSPGLFLSLALNMGNSVSQWVLSGFTLSLIIISLVTAIVQIIIGSPVRDGIFIIVVVGCSLVGFGILFARIAHTPHTLSLSWPLGQPYARITLGLMLVIPFLLLISLSPKFYWENFNGDGAHAYESARLLLVQPLPFWPTTAGGDIAGFPNVTSMLFAFPMSWFIRLFGEIEVSARLPLLLFLPPLYSAILALIEFNREKSVRIIDQCFIWLGIVVYVIVMAFSATYNPYSADIALPATQDTLLMVCYFGFILYFLKREWRWMILFIGLTYISLPNGLLLLGFWLLATLVIWKPWPRKQVILTITIIFGCFVFAAITPRILALFYMPIPDKEYGTINLLKRFAFLQFTDWYRLAFLVMPSGILPALSLFAWRWQDLVARILTSVTVLYFCFFFIQAHIVLHHFVPVMLLPLVVFWRNDLVVYSRYRPLILIATTLTGILALLVSLPTIPKPHTSARLIASTIDDRISGYQSSDPGAFQRSEILTHLFPYDWDPNVPFESYGGSPLVWNYYAHQPKSAAQEINYVLQSATYPGPPDMQMIAQAGDTALYVRDPVVWINHRAIRPPTPAGSRIYMIPRGVIFRSVQLENGPFIISVVDVIESLGVNMEPILDQLGVSRDK